MKVTQRQLILKYIEDFGSITPMEAIFDLGITKLATRVSEMRRDGIQFKIDTVKSKKQIRQDCKVCQILIPEGGNHKCLIS